MYKPVFVTTVLLCAGGLSACGGAGGATTPASKGTGDVSASCARLDALSQAKDQTCDAWLGKVQSKEPDVFACFTKCVSDARTTDDAATCVGACPKSMVAARMTVLAESVRELGTIEAASKNKYAGATPHTFCGASSSDPKDSGGNPQPASVPRATTATGDWSGGVWKCLAFSPATPTACQYDYVSSGVGPTAVFTATATCDHDGDGKGTFVTLKGKVDAAGQVVRESLVVTGDDDD